MKDIDYANMDTDLSTLKNKILIEYNKCKGVEIIDSEWLKKHHQSKRNYN